MFDIDRTAGRAGANPSRVQAPQKTAPVSNRVRTCREHARAVKGPKREDRGVGPTSLFPDTLLVAADLRDDAH
jgi:hypothetical protein